MAASSGPEFLFPGQGELDGLSCKPGPECGAKVPGPHLHLSAESAADERLDDPHLILPESQGRSEQALNDIRRLRGSPKGDAAPVVDVRQAGARFEIRVTHGLGREGVLPHVVRRSESRFQVPVCDVPGDAHVALGLFMEQRGVFGKGGVDVEHGGQFLVFHLDQSQGLFRDIGVHGDDRYHLVAHKPDLVHGEGGFVLRGREEPPVSEPDLGRLFSGDDSLDAREIQRPGRIDALDHRVGNWASQEFAVKHPRKAHVVRVQSRADGFLPCVRPRDVLPYDVIR